MDAGSTKRAQGRPARGETEVGSQKIVEGMRVALRTQRNTNVARKDIAHYAGVTPALVTYYFPERNSLIEAATLPIVQSLVEKIKACLDREEATRQDLVQAIEVLIEYYARDAVVIALFHDHRASIPDSTLPDLLDELDNCVRSFFERWLFLNPCVTYDAEFLQKAMVGTCKSITQPRNKARDPEGIDGFDRRSSAEMVCRLLLGPVSAYRVRDAATSIGLEGKAL